MMTRLLARTLAGWNAVKQGMLRALQVHRRTWVASTALFVLAIVIASLLQLLLQPVAGLFLPDSFDQLFSTGAQVMRTQAIALAPMLIAGLIATVIWSVGVTRLVQTTQAGSEPRVADGLAAGIRRLAPASITLGAASAALIAVSLLYPIIVIAGLLGLVLTPLGRRFAPRWPSVRSLLIMLIPFGPAVVLSSRWAFLLPEITRVEVTPRQAFANSRLRMQGQAVRVGVLVLAASLLVIIAGTITAFVLGLVNTGDGTVATGTLLGRLALAALPLIVLALLDGANGSDPADVAPQPISPRGRRQRVVAQTIVLAMMFQLVIPGFVGEPTALAQGADPVVITMVEPVGQAQSGDVIIAFTVDPVGGVGFAPTGELSLNVNEVPYGSVTQTNPNPGDINWRGRWEFTVPLPNAGNYSVVATYFGDSFYNLQQEFTSVDVVAASPTTMSLTTAPSPSFFGENVAVQAVVSSTGGTPTGAVVFTSSIDGALGTVPLDATGVASLDAISLSTNAAHTIVASYAAQNGFRASDADLIHNVSDVATTTTVTVAPGSPTTVGTPLDVSITVGADVGTAIPEGFVVVEILETVNGVTTPTTLPNLLLVNGDAVTTLASPVVGNYVFRAAYNPNAGFVGSLGQSPLHRVNQGTSTTTLTVTPGSSVVGQNVTLHASVAVGAIVPSPTGTVEFLTDSVSLGTAPLIGGNASLATTDLALGNANLMATYLGDINVTGSTSASVAHTVGQSAVLVTVSGDGATVVPTSDPTITVTVEGAAPGSGIPTGRVTLTDGTTPIGNPTALDATGQATFVLAVPDARAYPLTATYDGDSNYLLGSGTATVNAVAVSTRVFFSQSSDTSTYGDPITFDAQIVSLSDGGSIPPGTIELRGPSGTIESRAVDAAGRVQFVISDLDHRPRISGSSGLSSLSARYIGQGRYAGSSSGAVTHDVQQATPTMSLSWTPTVVSSITNTTLTALVTGVNATPPGGQVTFFAYPSNTRLGSANLVTGEAVLVTRLDTETRSIFTEYSGETNYKSTELVTPLVVSADRLDPTLSVEPSPAHYGQIVTLRALAPAIGGFVPTGPSEQVRFVFDIDVHDADQFEALVAEMVAISNDEPGTLVYDWYQKRETNKAKLYEVYESIGSLIRNRRRVNPSAG